MSEMAERIRHALFAAADDAHNTWPTPSHFECVRMSNAVLRAIQEPTLEMLDAAANSPGRWSEAQSLSVWHAMANAAAETEKAPSPR